jgi:hypothetical protein
MRPLKTLKSVYEEDSHIVITDKKSPPRVIFSGEDFLLEDLPVDTRVIFPRPPLAPVPNAGRHPLGHQPPRGLRPPARHAAAGHEGHHRPG